MSKNWKLKPHVSEEFCSRFPEFSSLGAQLLFNRGLEQREQVDAFVDPGYDKLHNPFLFKDMQKTVDRIWQAIEEKEKICIYGDYDADAVTANAVLQQALGYLGVECESYIPDRFTEGYGVNMEAVKKIKDGGCKVIISVDCGTNSTDVAEWCKNNGVDFIITDHHEIIDAVPDAYALINPKNPGDAYPYHEITGVGVAFKLASAMLQDARSKQHVPNFVEGYEKWLLDLVAIGTVADCHSLMGENRIIVKFGLKVLAKTRWLGLRALMESSGLNFSQKLPDTYTLGFTIAPRLNAAGRLEHANVALHLLMEKDFVAAQQKSMELEAINVRRQDLTQRVLSEAREQAELLGDRKVLVLLGKDWPKGVVGLAAGRVADEFHRPAIVLEKGETESTGSARTVGNFNVVEALKAASKFLIKFGGHAQAAGLTLRTADYEEFYKTILNYAEQHLTAEDLEPQLVLEAKLEPADISLETLKLLEKFEPFGVANPKPKFLVEDLKITSIRGVGQGEKHLQFKFDLNIKIVEGVMFNCASFAKNLKVGDTIDAAAELIADDWNGRNGVKLRLIDVKRNQST